MPAESSRAVFLSYASQDADAARRICEALRAAGVDVWFDQSELSSGDAWDARFARSFELFREWRCRLRGDNVACVSLRSAGVWSSGNPQSAIRNPR